MISIGQLDCTGYATKFGKSSWKIMKGAMMVARGTKSGTLYPTARCMNRAAAAEVFQIEVYDTIELDIVGRYFWKV